MGLVIFGALAVYVIVLVAVTWFAYRWAAKRGLSRGKRWLAAMGGFLAVYLPVFWDHIPTLVAHKYYCEKEAGFWVYKTLDQWNAENLGVAATLVAKKGSPSTRQGDMENYTDTYSLNSRFIWIVKHNGQFLFNRWRHEQEVVDVKTGNVLARYVDFSTSQIRRQAGWSGWKMWLDVRHCSGGERDQNNLRQFKNNFPGVEK